MFQQQTLSQLGSIEGCPTTQPDIERIISQAQILNDRVWGLSGAFSRTADALLGEAGDCANSASCAPVRSGAIGRVEDMLDAISNGIDRLDAQAARLSRVA